MNATVHFNIRSERPQADNTAPIYLIFSLGKNQKTKVSLKKDVPVKKEFKHLTQQDIIHLDKSVRSTIYCWDDNMERTTSQAPNSEKLNKFLDSEKKRANDIILKFELMNKPITTTLFRQLFCKPSGDKRLLDYFLDELKTRRAEKWSEETIRTYKSILTKIQLFKPNLTLNDFNYKFLLEYENYMLKPKEKGGLGNCERTVANNMKILKTMLIIAIKNKDYLAENSPFEDYKINDTSAELTTRDYLEPSEIHILEQMYNNYVAPDKPMHRLSPEDWAEREKQKIITPGEHEALRRFLFSCYTGLRFRDMLLLEKEKHLYRKTNDSNPETNPQYYIEITMHKMKRPVVIPLVEKALKLIDVEKSGSLLPHISNQKVNGHLKNIQEKSGIDKYLTFHVSRHSFATICFLYGIDERVGQRLLGHKNRKFTEIYTHLSHGKLFLEMDKFNNGINALGKSAPISKNDQADDLLPLLQNLSPDKLDQLKGLIRILGS